jgi:lipoate-protein ligase A
MIQWHLVLEGRCPSRLNMEQDSALFESVRRGKFTGALRVYNWDEPAVTVGYHQKRFQPSDTKLAIPVLRRPTGGGAVLHGNDVTFSISAPRTGPFAGGVIQCCTAISGIFARALNKCGIHALIKGGSQAFSPVCFLRSSPAELCVGDSKILGLALLRTREHVLVQGVLPLSTDRELAERVFGTDGTPAVNDILSHLPTFSRDVLVEGLIEAFASELDITLETV